jgi:hypothetical protein
MHMLFLHFYNSAMEPSPTSWEKCSIITKTYQLCRGVKLNGLAKSKLHWYPHPINDKGYKWGVGASKDAWIWSHTIHLETNCSTCNCIPCHQYHFWNKLYVYRTPNGPTPHEHASQGFHLVMGEAQPSLVHLPTSVGGNYLPIWIIWPYAQHGHFH